MQTIFKLPDHLVAQIAAGEVVERPSFVVKELVENALDSGATVIKADLVNGGLSNITVTDNGCGMSEEDVIVCSRLHTTSKLLHTDSLSAIKSLGFRGEALSSIAAVSRVTIQSRLNDVPVGTKITLENGNVVHTGRAGMPPGTIVIVGDLFAALPGRRKFLKSPRTELRNSLDIFIRFVLAYPGVRFTFTHNKKVLLDIPADSMLQDRLKILEGEVLANQSIQVSYNKSYAGIEGLCVHPQLAFNGTEKLYIFVNKRAVRDKLIASAVKDAYGNLLEPAMYPFVVLSITLPFEYVDVNVHPRKERVAFSDARFIYTAVYDAVTQALSERNLTFHTVGLKDSEYGLAETNPTQSFAGRVLKEAVNPWNTHLVGQRDPAGEIVQIHNTYLLVPSKLGVLVVDIHALHEKLLYEKFKKEFVQKSKSLGSVKISKPVTLSIPAADLPILEENTTMFRLMGFTFRKVKETFVLVSVPDLLHDRDPETIIKELLDDAKNERPMRSADTISERMLEYLACRTAYKAGQALTQDQMKELVAEMDSHPEIVTCPHGRPVKLELSLDQLHKLFRRT